MLRTESSLENKTAFGAYVVDRNERKERQATILATGSEVSLAMEAQKILSEKGINAVVVSMPCWELFDRQEDNYKKDVLGTAPRVAVEAASGFGWEKYVGENGRIIAMNGFGASGPADRLYEHFGITVENIVKAVENLVQK